MATYDNIPLSWNDPLLSGVSNSGSVTLRDGGTLSNVSITDSGNLASVVGQGAFTLDHVRINSREGVRIGGDGDVYISNSYLESTGVAGDHADTIQAYSPGSTGNVTITNTTIVAHNNNATAGMFIADNYGGTLTLNNVVFQGGPFGLRVAADNQDISISLTNVYFVGPFLYDDFLLQEVNADIRITHWENVRSATIVNGELVPGPLLSPPFPVEGGGGTSTTIDDFSNDSGTDGDGITNDNALTLTGTAAANSTVRVLDGTTQIGTATTDSNGAWTYTTKTLSEGSHSLTAMVGTGAASAPLAVRIDTTAPIAPTISTPTNNANGGLNLTGSAEANSVVRVYDGATAIGTATANGSGVWNYTTGALSAGSHNLTARATDAAGNTGGTSPVVTATTGGTAPTPPAAPRINSYSNDSGTRGDGVTNDNTLSLTGTAAANSTVRVFDGTTPLGTAIANSSGVWTYTSGALSNGNHNFTATATTASGTSSASSTLAVRIDTIAPSAPTIGTPTNNANGGLNLAGTAEANSVVNVYDGSAQIGTATANGSGVWSYSTGALAAGSHSLVARATDAAGNTGANSAVVTASTGTTAPAAPRINTVSNDTGIAGDRITSDNTLTLAGAATANSTVRVFDGTNQIGTTTSNSSGAWTYTTAALADGNHNLTARATDSRGTTSPASSTLAVTIDTTAPTAPSIASMSSDGVVARSAATAASATSTVDVDHVTLSGTAEANSTVRVFDGTAQIGTATANAGGTWSYTADDLNDGTHSFTSRAVDAAGNTSNASAAMRVTVDTHSEASDFAFSNLWQRASDRVSLQGTADANDRVTIYDNGGGTRVGTTTTDSDGRWTLTTSSPLSDDVVHRFTATVTDSSGRTTSTSTAILGTNHDNRLTSTSGDDLFRGNGGHDTFVFAANFGRDAIADFGAGRYSSDVVQFSRSVFDNFADVLSHASQHGQDVVIDAGGGNTLTLQNTSLSSLDRSDFHFV